MRPKPVATLGVDAADQGTRAMRAAFCCVVLAAFCASAGMAIAQGMPAPAMQPVEPQMTGSPASPPLATPPLASPPLAAQPPTTQPASGPRPVAQPRPVQIRGVPPGVVNPRRPRTFVQCNQEALRRGMRGAERRHWIQRCELGYGRPLFRRRGPTVTQPAATNDTTPLTPDHGEAGAP